MEILTISLDGIGIVFAGANEDGMRIRANGSWLVGAERFAPDQKASTAK